jgi:hypothetical protein
VSRTLERTKKKKVSETFSLSDERVWLSRTSSA